MNVEQKHDQEYQPFKAEIPEQREVDPIEIAKSISENVRRVWAS